MKIIIWSSDALDDLNEIFNFYLPKSNLVATQIHNSILDEIDRLSEWPQIGKKEDFIDNRGFEFEFRSLVICDGLYKAIYFIESDELHIVRIWSCKKDLKNLQLP